MRWNHLYTWWIWYQIYRSHCYLLTVRDHSVLVCYVVDYIIQWSLSFVFLQTAGPGSGWLVLRDHAPSGYSYARLLLYFLTQARIGHWRLQGSQVGHVCDSVSYIAELLINARILCHIGGGRGVQDQSQADDDEGQQVKAWKLKADKQHNELHIVCLKTDLELIIMIYSFQIEQWFETSIHHLVIIIEQWF